uniref:Protoporphyrinogen oxidase n=1 Tax=Strigomonas galati TaxID=1003336 RepID=G1C9P9_9TRYP|nr:protoporphyrinogen oxidase [Strigomonas galati]
MKYLILFSTTGGHTKVIAEAIADEVRAQESGAECTIQDIKVFMTHNTLTSEGVVDMKHYDKVVLGASVRYNSFAQEVHQFVKQYQTHLNSIPSAFYVVDMVAYKEHRNTPETNPYSRRFLRASPWKPTKVAVFAGALYYPRYSFFDRNLIRCIMKLAGGETDPKTEKVYTDWDSVKAFAQEIVGLSAGDVTIAQEEAQKVEREEAVKERTSRLYRMCFMSVVAVVAGVTKGVVQRKLLK